MLKLREHWSKGWFGMSIESEIEELSNYALSNRQWLTNEEALKTSVVLRLFAILGYDIHNPREIIPEYVADVGTKRGEKVDYALMIDGKVQIIVECKSADVDLAKVGLSQLFRYYATTEARFAILTNGYVWHFFADTEMPNKMDLKPFLTLDLNELVPQSVASLSQFCKSRFDPDSVARAAIDARLDRKVMREITSELSHPSAELVRMITRRVHDGKVTQRILDEYTVRIQKVMRQTLQQIASIRAEQMMDSEAECDASPNTREMVAEQSEIVTTKQEIEGFEIALKIASFEIDPARIVMRDQKTYCSVLVDNNNRKTLLRMWFNNPDRLQVEFFDASEPTKVSIASPDEMLKYADRIRVTARGFRHQAA